MTVILYLVHTNSTSLFKFKIAFKIVEKLPHIMEIMKINLKIKSQIYIWERKVTNIALP